MLFAAAKSLFQAKALLLLLLLLRDTCRRDGVYQLVQGYDQDILAADVLQYLQSREKDSSKPFFLYFAPNAVHT
jgi:hypothetical protein